MRPFLFMTTKNQIVEEARTWLGTRFHHQGRIKKTALHDGGCDCIGLIVGVVRALELPSKVEGIKLYENDSSDYGYLPNGDFLQSQLAQHLTEVPKDSIEAGDVLLFRFRSEPQHVGIVTDYSHGGLGIIHCYAGSRMVVEHALDNTWKKRIISAYQLIFTNN